ncbi:MAG: PilZ domain-containing protein [Colwellia sp.]|nr:PilZ domain-containing protein [Colwellia sp.]
MNKDFSKYSRLIERFRGLVNKRSFERLFTEETEQLTQNDKFLLKMELKRLATECNRGIDLRGLVNGECQLFDYQGQSHFLDEVAIATFKHNVELYGNYTFGVYEAVKDAKNSFRNLYQNEEIAVSDEEATTIKKKLSSEKAQYPATLQFLSNYPDRADERMNFATPISVTLLHNQQVVTTSIDLSIKGIKFKLSNEVPLYKGDQVVIAFTGLEKEFQFRKDLQLSYEVKNVKSNSGTQLIGCQRILIPDNDGFERFLSGYIQGNKLRYKINLENSLSALQARGFEQFSLVKINELPVFMHCENNDITNITPRYALTTKNNQKLYQYWQGDKKQSTLSFLINPERFERLQALENKNNSLLVFSFIHLHKGHKFFYSIDEQQLIEDKAFFHQFLAFAASKSTFAITALKAQAVSPGQAYSPFTLSTAMTKQQGYINPPLSDEVKAIIANLPYVVTATDITTSSDISAYQALEYTGIDLERLKSYGHKYGNKPSIFDEITISFGHQRQEVRFKYNTPVSIKCHELTLSGHSSDFSVSGLKIELDNEATLFKGDIVYLTFPNLQKITSEFDLKHLPYKVIRVNKDSKSINLRVSVKEHQHIGRSFFKLLINKNKSKLTPDEYAMLTPGLSSALRTMYAVNMAIPTAMVQSSGSRYKVETIVVGQYGYQDPKNLLSAMLRLSDRHGYYNLYPLLGGLQSNNLLDKQMKKLTASDLASEELIHIAIRPEIPSIEKSVTIKFESDFKTPEMKGFFVKQSLKQGDFYSIKLKLSRTDEAFIKHLSPELAYISSYAIHRGKQLEQEIYSVAGLIQFIDVTQETLLRYSFTN